MTNNNFPFKVGDKIRCKSWADPALFIEVLFVGQSSYFGRDIDENEGAWDLVENWDDYELYAEPKKTNLTKRWAIFHSADGLSIQEPVEHLSASMQRECFFLLPASVIASNERFPSVRKRAYALYETQRELTDDVLHETGIYYEVLE